MNTPRQIVTAAFDALMANDWKRLASLCDPLSLDAFKIEMLEEFGAIPADEQELAQRLHHSATPEFATCRRQPDGSWKLVASRDLRLVSYSKCVEPGPTGGSI